MQAERLGVEIWGAVVWLVAGLIAFILPHLVSMPLASTAPALFETLVGLPLALWLALITAQSLASGSWRMVGGRHVLIVAQPSTYWVFTGIAVLLSGVFLAGFVRGLISLLALA